MGAPTFTVSGSEVAADEDPLMRVLVGLLPWVGHGELFATQALGAARFPDQGWKIHVSATPGVAIGVVERTLPVLLAEGARFKIVPTLDRLWRLNAGRYGMNQVGKFITVYPSDDEMAVRLATGLHSATEGLSGPMVPTDRPLRPGSLVHYRYGAFRRLPGSDEPFLLDPAGRVTPDHRPPHYIPPAGVVDPFEAAGAYVPPTARTGALAGRYLVHDVMWRSWRGGVFRAIDLGSRPARACVVKEARHDVGVTGDGRDARAWAHREADLLTRHHDDPLLPTCFDRFDLDGNTYVVLEYVEGTPVALSQGNLAPEALVAVARGAGDALAHLHDVGIIFRDFKPEHIVRTPGGTFRLVDFGLAYDTAGNDSPLPGGTVAYTSPEQWNGAAPRRSADVFSWGATMHMLACGPPAEGEGPSGGRPWPRRPVLELRPTFPPALASVIDRAVAWDPADRYATMRDALDAVSEAERRSGTTSLVESRPSGVVRSEPAPARECRPADAARRALEVGDALCDTATESDGGLIWAPDPGGTASPDIYDGVAGVALYLAALARTTGDARYADAAKGAGRWLAGPEWARGRAAPGLHGGEAGVGLLFVRMAAQLGEPGWLTAASLKARRLQDLPYGTVDLVYGAAGTALFLAELALVTGEGEHMGAARRAGDHLLAKARPGPNGCGTYWMVPSPDPSFPDRPYLGMAHGAAGIGVALTTLTAATGDDRFLAGALGCAELLVDQAVVQPDGAWRWPALLNEAPSTFQAWCHGAGGIGRFFLGLNRVIGDSRFVDAARGAARTIADGLRERTVSGSCCGLAGDGGFLLDCYQTLGDAVAMESAIACGRRLEAFGADQPVGRYRLEIDEPPSSVDLMQGSTGVGAFWLRLAHPEIEPDLVLGRIA